MIGDVSVRGRVERFLDSVWEPIHLGEYEIVDEIGELGGYAYVLLDGIPVRYIIESDDTFVEVAREELLFA